MAAVGTIVITGQAAGLSPEPMNTDDALVMLRLWVLDLVPPAFMGSGLAALPRPGMTAMRPC